MNGQNCLNGLDLDHDFVIYQKVDPKTAVNLKFLVRQGHLELPFDVDSTVCEFEVQALFADSFKQARAKGFVYLERGVNDHAGGLVHRVGYRHSLCFSLCLCGFSDLR